MEELLELKYFGSPARKFFFVVLTKWVARPKKSPVLLQVPVRQKYDSGKFLIDHGSV